jgi:hypothetical protein
MPLLSRSLGCLELFSNSHFSAFGHHSRGSASLPDYHENHMTWVDSSLVVPLELYWSFDWFFGHCSRSPASLLGLHKNHLVWVDSNLLAPLGCYEPPLTLLSLPAHLSQEPSDLSELNPDSPFWLACKSSVSSPWDSLTGRSRHINFLHCSIFCLIFYWIFCFIHYFPITVISVWPRECIPGILIPKLVISSATLSQ